MNSSSFFAIAIGGNDLLGLTVLASCLVWPVAALWFYKFLHWSIQGDLDWLVGLPALVSTLLLAASVTWVKHPIYSPFIAMGMFVALVALPFVTRAMNTHAHRSIDRDQLTRAVRVASQSTSKAPRMRIATELYQAGHGDWAVALAEQALPEMPAHMFPHEHGMFNAWKQIGHSADRAMPLSCLACGRRNGPEDVVCAGCGHTYLVDHATGGGGSGTVVGRKMIGLWCVAMLLLVGIPSAAAFLENEMALAIVIGVLVAVAGWVSWRSFSEKSN